MGSDSGAGSDPDLRVAVQEDSEGNRLGGPLGCEPLAVDDRETGDTGDVGDGESRSTKRNAGM